MIIGSTVLLLGALALGVASLLLSRRLGTGASFWRRLAIIGLLAFISLQAALGGQDDSERPVSADIVLMIDRTASMGAQDWNGSQPRIDGVASDVESLVEAIPDARYAVVVFDNDARVAVPWTTDTAAVVTMARTVGWREAQLGTGSDISVGVDTAVEVLEDSADARADTPRFLVYFGDGEQTASSEPASFAPARDLVSDALVLGYGTSQGGQMAVSPGSDELVTRDGVVQRSRIDEAALRRIAEELGGRYEHRSAPGSVPLSVPDAGPLIPTDIVVGEAGERIPLSWLAALALVPLIGWELWVAVRSVRRAAEEIR